MITCVVLPKTRFSEIFLTLIQTIESERPCHGEIFETFESTVTNFEAEQACWPNYYQPPPPFCRLPLYPTSASAHCALMQRRINLYRDVLAATARYADDVFKRDDGDVTNGQSRFRTLSFKPITVLWQVWTASKNQLRTNHSRDLMHFAATWQRIYWGRSSSLPAVRRYLLLRP